MTEQQRYDITIVINALGKLSFFDDISERTVIELNKNIKILEALKDKETK